MYMSMSAGVVVVVIVSFVIPVAVSGLTV